MKMLKETAISIITLNVNELSVPTKRHRLVDGRYKNKNLHICCLQQIHFRSRDTSRLKVKGWKDTHANASQNKVGVATLISEKVDFKIKTITRDKEGHYIMIKESIQEYVTIVNIYAPKISASQQIRQMLTDIKKWEIDSNTIIVQDFNTTLKLMVRLLRQKKSRKCKP